MIHRLHPLVWGVVLALLALNLSTVVPAWGIDSSFRVLLSVAALERQQFGVDLIWPFGPLGFLAGPTIISRAHVALAIVYQLTALALLFTSMVVHLAGMGVERWRAAAVLLPVALGMSIADNLVPETVGVAILAVLLVLRDKGSLDNWPSAWPVFVATGAAAGSLILVKFGPGGFACAMVMCLAAVSAHRVRATALALLAIIAGFIAAWLATGQALWAIPEYFRTELEVVGGYQQAQAYGPDGKKVAVLGAVALLALGLGVAVAWKWFQRDRKAWQVLVPLALAIWFVTKQSLIRWDAWHAVGGLLLTSLLVAMLHWERRWHVLMLGLLLLGGAGAIATGPSRLLDTWSHRFDGLMSTAFAEYQAARLETARTVLQADYAVPAPVIRALAGGTVHAEPWDINAVWANGLAMSVLPTPQSYATYTAELDRINAGKYASAEGPDGVLFSPDSTVDTRYGPWESPDARVALTCHFAAVAAEGPWVALRRAPDACGPARPLGTVSVEPGMEVPVPNPSGPHSLVVARFELPHDLPGKLVAAVARPLRYSYVTLDGTRHRLVTGTAAGAHLLKSPGRIGSRELPHGQLSHSSLAFENVGSGTITVRFEEIPLVER